MVNVSESCFMFSPYATFYLDNNHDSRQPRLNSSEELLSPTITFGSIMTWMALTPLCLNDLSSKMAELGLTPEGISLWHIFWGLQGWARHLRPLGQSLWNLNHDFPQETGSIQFRQKALIIYEPQLKALPHGSASWRQWLVLHTKPCLRLNTLHMYRQTQADTQRHSQPPVPHMFTRGMCVHKHTLTQTCAYVHIFPHTHLWYTHGNTH